MFRLINFIFNRNFIKMKCLFDLKKVVCEVYAQIPIKFS